MMEVAVITDTSACLPKELVDKYGIEIVPMEFIHEGKVYRDEIDVTPAEFYKLLSKARELPTTSAPSPGSYFEAIKKTAKQAKSILLITPSAKLTHAFSSARAAAEVSKEKVRDTVVEVLDCGTAAGAQAFVVLEAAKAALLGKSLSQVVAAARDIMPRVQLVALIDTLDYLAKGGRVPHIIAWANSFLNIKPLFRLLPLGRGATPLDRVRTRAKAIERLMKILKKTIKDKPLHCVVVHANALDEAEEMKKRLCSQFNCVEAYIKDFTPVMGVHTGPGLLGVAFYTES